MNSKVLVHCQYFENYNVDINGFGEVPHWKPKGGHTFQMPIDSDVMFYADEDKVIQAIKIWWNLRTQLLRSLSILSMS